MNNQHLTSVLATPIVPVVVLKLRYLELPPNHGEPIWTFVSRTDKCTEALIDQVLPRIGLQPFEVGARDYLTVTAEAFEGGNCTLMPGDFVVIHSNGSYNFIVGKGLTASIDGERLILTVN